MLGKKYALLIGINYTGTPSQLSGCVNDIEKMEEILRKEEFIIKSLKDVPIDSKNKPTRDNIIHALEDVCKNSCKDDIIYIHYSGHGSQLKALGSDEVDGYDETWCPCDSRGSEKYIRDNEILQIISKNVQKETKVIIVSDSCHSGTIVDLPFSWTIKSYFKNENRQELDMNILSISGCRDKETSIDAFEENTPQGACSWALRKSLKHSKLTGIKLKYKDLVEEMRNILSNAGYEQYPVLSVCKKSQIDNEIDF